MDETLEKGLYRVLPIAEWLPEYGLEEARSDMTAGLTVGVMLIPQAMAYAVLAGVPPIYGLFASLVPLLVYPLFGTSRHMAVGISAISMVIVAAGVSQFAETGTAEYVALAILLTALVGGVMVLMGLARLGFLANLISRPVITGFAAAAGLVIAAGQLGNLLGVELGQTQLVHAMVAEAAVRLVEAHPLSVGMGGAAILVILALRRWAPQVPSELAVVVVGTLATWALGLEGAGVEVVGDAPSGLPVPGLVDVELSTVAEMWPTVLSLAAVQFMMVVSLGRVFAARHKYTIDANQELVAVGVSNVVGSFFQSLPVAGSFSRSSVNEKAGARTALSNVFAAALIGATLLFFTPLLHPVPMPVLAALVIVAGVDLVDLEELRFLFEAKRSDGWVAFITLATTLGVGLEEGILIGIGTATLALLYRISRPHVAELGHLPSTRAFKRLERFAEAEPMRGVLVLRVEAGFSFVNAKFLRDYILRKTREEGREIRAVVIDGMSINFLDTTAVEALEGIIESFDERGIEIHFAGLTAPVRDVMEDSGLGDWIGEDRFHIDPYHAVLDILSRWDEEEGTARVDEYEATVEQEREEVEPTSESRLL